MNAKQKRFVEEYLKDLNATDAAKRAGYAAQSAEVTGHRLLRNAKIADAISEAQQKRSERTQITSDRVLQELGRIGLSDLRGAFDEHGRIKRPEDWSQDLARAVSSVEVVTRKDADGEIEYVHKLRLWDKVSALDKIGKHLGMFVERHEHTGADGGPIQTQTTFDASALSDQALAEIMAARKSDDSGT